MYLRVDGFISVKVYRCIVTLQKDESKSSEIISEISLNINFFYQKNLRLILNIFLVKLFIMIASLILRTTRKSVWINFMNKIIIESNI